MRIASSNVTLSSTHLAAERSTRRESLRAWVEDRRPNFEALEGGTDRGGRDGNPRLRGRDGNDGGSVRGHDDSAEDRRSLNARRVAGLARRLGAEVAAQLREAHDVAAASPKPVGKQESKQAAGIDGSEDDLLNSDPKAVVIKLLVEAMTGRKIKVISLDELREAQVNAEATIARMRETAEQPQRVGWGVEYDLHESHHEIEQTSFAAQGLVRTADGKEITFSYALDMEREFYSETSLSVRAGDAVLKDPLVINFGGTAAQLTERKFAFDLDANGTQEQISWVQPGSGFLALDKNGNGAIDDGSELFGAMTGDGFAELAAYDDDQNGWIDEADAVYSRLLVWSKSGTTDQLASLQERNVGAISLGQVATPFQVKDGANQLQGAVRASGIYVKEDGSGVGSVQQIDLAV